MKKVKKILHLQCINFVENRFQTIQNTIKEIQESLGTETKSSAGDKHETGRAMLQLEREKVGNQLAEIQKIKEVLFKINIESQSEQIGLGSVVYTSKANYFIAISAGELQLGNELFYAISASTPIAKLLLGKTIGDQINFRDKGFKIIKVF